MKNYKYIARNSDSERIEGMKKASSSQELLIWLRRQNLTPVSFAVVGTTRRMNSQRVKAEQLSSLCWQLNTMVEGGIPVVQAINIIAEDTENVTFRQAMMEISNRMQKGEAFSTSAARFPKVFGKLFCAMISAGEQGGALPSVLNSLAIHFENRDKLTKKIKSAMAYPIFVLSFVVVIIIAIMTFIIPRFRVIFDQIGTKLPVFTRAFMAFYDSTTSSMIYIILSIAFLVFAFYTFMKSENGHKKLSKLVLSIPFIGTILSKAFMVIFCRTLSVLLSAGVSILDALNILSGMTGNDLIRNAIIKTRDHIVEGSSISLSMAETGFFPNLIVKMVQVGEESGALPKALSRTSDYYEKKVDAEITTIMGWMEPLLIVLVGSIVLVVVLALYLPIFSISNIKH